MNLPHKQFIYKHFSQMEAKWEQLEMQITEMAVGRRASAVGGVVAGVGVGRHATCHSHLKKSEFGPTDATRSDAKSVNSFSIRSNKTSQLVTMMAIIFFYIGLQAIFLKWQFHTIAVTIISNINTLNIKIATEQA